MPRRLRIRWCFSHQRVELGRRNDSDSIVYLGHDRAKQRCMTSLEDPWLLVY